MTVSERHAEWISLLEVSGPFLAVAVLEEAFPMGLDKVDTPFRQRIRSAYDEWRDAIDEDDPQLDAIHREWGSLVVRDFLEYDATVLRSGEDIPASLLHHDVASDSTFRPDFAVMSGDKARLLISVTAPGTRLDDPLPSDSWLASPAERLTQLCRTCGVPLGIVTNGERWMVVSAPADGGSSRASWYARLWLQEPVTLQAFYSLLGVRRCFGEEKHTLDALIRQSLEHQDEITDTLGEQVRRAVEVLVQALDRADQDRNRTLLQNVTPAQLFEAGLTVMMRLVVLLCAEERKLLLLGEPVYDQNYAITTLRAQLVEQASHGLEILERRQDAWSRLLATFRGIYGGIHHETLRLPPLGGSLFDPDRFPFLEGRAPGTSWLDTPAVPLPIDNRTVILLLNALQVLEHKSGAQLLSYESLDVEQIGHVYEGLLERTVKRVPEVTLGLLANSAVRKKTGHPELPLSALEEKAEAGDDVLLPFLVEKTGRSKSALTKDLDLPLKQSSINRLLLACGNDLALMERVRSFGQLLRTDSWEDPLVYPANAFIVTHGVGRRETGSHYTPKSLTEPIVEHTLEPLVYVGPAEGVPRADWKLKAPHEILALKVCDMAMGSGAFLVQACRYLADRLVEAWAEEEKRGRAISIEGHVLDRADDAELLPHDRAERALIARRLVASKCLHGVDINPMAVELAKLSLWLVTMMKGRPFSFLDHSFKYGDSLLGVSSIEQIENFSLRRGDRQITFSTSNLFRYLEEAAAKRSALEDLPSNDHAQIETKNRLHVEAEAATSKVKALADCLIAFELRGLDGKAYEDQRNDDAEKVQLLMKRDSDASLKSQSPTVNQLSGYAREQLRGRRPFHWAVEFPEVFVRGGFDAFVGNPPFMGGHKITGNLGVPYRHFLVAYIALSSGSADICAYFILRAAALLQKRATFGFVATSSLAEGDTREVCLDRLAQQDIALIRAASSVKWPGTASVTYIPVWGYRGGWKGGYILNNSPVSRITPFLTEPSQVSGRPFRLLANAGQSFAGCVVYGMGFVITAQQAELLILQNNKNRDVLHPYLTGKELNSSYNHAPSQWVIHFRDWPLDRNSAPAGYRGPVAADYPECLAIVKSTVKEERAKKAADVAKAPWWQFWRQRVELYNQIERSNCVFAIATQATKYVAFAVITDRIVFSHAVAIITNESWAVFASINSNLHEAWCRAFGSYNLALLRYSLSDLFESFPFPNSNNALDGIGRQYAERRGELMANHKEGLTDIYNRFHDRNDQSPDIARLRALHGEMDQVVAAAYGWSDLDLGHGFHATKQGERYTLSEPARREVLDRLLALNHQRYDEEVKAGLQDKKKGGAKRKAKAAPSAAPGVQELNLDFSATAHKVTRLHRVPQKSADVPKSKRTAAAIDQTELLNATFTCTARRESTDREELTREVATALGFQRLREKTRDLIASGFNSAIRRGLIGYEGAFIVRLASAYADLELDTLVKAISATVRPGRTYTPDEVFYNAADYLGCKRLGEAFREALNSALNAAIRRGLVTKRGGEIRRVD